MSGRFSRTIYVGNLPSDIRESEIEDLFYKVGFIIFLYSILWCIQCIIFCACSVGFASHISILILPIILNVESTSAFVNYAM